MAPANSVYGWDNYRCSDFGAWQTNCDNPGTAACDVPYESGAYCIARCYSSTCSTAQDASKDFKWLICNTYNYSSDFVNTGLSGQIDLAIHRNKNSNCNSYQSTTFDSVPSNKQYPEDSLSNKKKISK